MKPLFLLSVIALIAGLVVKAFFQLLSPTEIEPERIRPQANISLPKIQAVPDAIDYFLEPPPSWSPKNGEPYPLVHMRVPKVPYYERNSPTGPWRKYEVYLTMFYPNFSGLADAENSECGVDAKIARGNSGFCRREMNVGFGFGFALSHSEALLRHNLENDLRRGFIQPLPNTSKYAGLELVGEQAGVEPRDTYYLSRDAQGKPEFVIQCSEHVPSPACSTSFRATKSPYIYVSLEFVLSLLPQWREVINATRQKVDSMIMTTYYLPPSK